MDSEGSAWDAPLRLGVSVTSSAHILQSGRDQHSRNQAAIQQANVATVRKVVAPDYDSPMIFPVSGSMSMSKKAGRADNPGIVLIVPSSG